MMPEILVEVVARMHTQGKDEPSIYPLGDVHGESLGEVLAELQWLFAELPTVFEAAFSNQRTATNAFAIEAEIEAALSRSDERWNTRASGTDASRAYRDRATLAAEVRRLRTAVETSKFTDSP